ncbi:MAG: oxygenase MpaB family protein [Sporichthyaceae bacterium]
MGRIDVGRLRARAGQEIFRGVAGPNGDAARSRIHDTPGPRWFEPDRPIRRVHADASMFVGGLRALLLQSLHPLAMAAVADNSAFRDDPLARLQRTATFLAATTYATAEDAQAAVERVRRIHAGIHGSAPDGTAYSASDPHLLRWVHVAEVDSFLRAHQIFGKHPLDVADADGYVADTARIAVALGAEEPPRSVAELAEHLAEFRPELQGTAQSRAAARFLLLTPPLPLPARPPYALLAANAVSLMPLWARRALRLPYLPVAESTAVRLGGHALVRGIRWAMS